MLWQSPLKRVNIARNWLVIFILLAPKNYVIFLEIEMMKSFRIWPDIVQCAELKTCVQNKICSGLEDSGLRKKYEDCLSGRRFFFFPLRMKILSLFSVWTKNRRRFFRSMCFLACLVCFLARLACFLVSLENLTKRNLGHFALKIKQYFS